MDQEVHDEQLNYVGHPEGINTRHLTKIVLCDLNNLDIHFE